jgi:hypothetical protein
MPHGRNAFALAVSVADCGLKLILAKPLNTGLPLLRFQPSTTPGPHDSSHVIELYDVELDIHAVVAVLHHFDARQCRKPGGDRSSMIGGGRQDIATVRIDVAVPTGNHQQPWIARPDVATLSVAILLTLHSILLAKALLQIDA